MHQRQNTCGVFSGNLQFWINGVVELVLAIIAFLSHSVVLTVLVRQDLATIFSRLLVVLAVSDNLHYICSISISSMNLNRGGPSFFGTYLPQFHSIFHMNSFYTFLALVVERILALTKIQNSTGSAKRYADYTKLNKKFFSLFP